jgi:glutathione S-transferase
MRAHERLEQEPSEDPMHPAQPITLYGYKLSGNSHRAELMLRLLGLPFSFHEIDVAAGAQREEPFLRLNPFATVPVIDDGGTVVADSGAILVYLATHYDKDRTWLPVDPVGAAEVQRWLSAAQGWLAFGPAQARAILKWGRKYDLATAQALAQRLFKVLDATLSERAFLTGSAPTLADVALYSYTAVSPEGGIDLAPYPAIRPWLGRIEKLPGFEGMPQ